MDRKEFLKYCGVVFLGAIGLSGILRLLASSDSDLSSVISDKKGSKGFGSGKYGG